MLAIAIATLAIGTVPPVATAAWQHGSNSGTAIIAGTATPSGGWAFVYAINDGTVSLSFNYAADLDPVGGVKINGSTTFENLTNAAITASASFEVDICPAITDTEIGGIASMKMITNADGGTLSCGDQPFVQAAASDGQVAYTLYYCPFSMVRSGAATATTTANFGIPVPSLAGPSAIGSLGQFNSFTLTGGDKAIFSLLYGAEGDSPDPCDVNGDGVVDGADLGDVIAYQGFEGWCLPTDINRDGIVDSADLGIILGCY